MYEGFFGLADAPFRLTPDPRYLVLTAAHADALAHLRLGLVESSGFVCITGDVGTGKTTVLRQFLAELGPEVQTAYVINPTLSPLELLRTLHRELGLVGGESDRQALVDRLNAHLLAQRRAGRTCVVVVDEAQALSLEVLEHLRLLSNLETTTEKLLRIVLVGQPQLRTLLLHPELLQLNQRITLRWHIGPLSAAETAAYVRHRLAVAAGGEPRDLFTGAALRALHRRTGGIPRLINMVAHRALIAAFVRGRRRVTARLVARAIAELESVPLPRPHPPPRRRAALALGGAAAGAAAVLIATRVPPASLVEILPRTRSSPAPAPAAADTATHAVSQPPSPSPPPEAPLSVIVPDDSAAVAERLAGIDTATSARQAMAALLARWRLAPLIVPEGGLPVDYPAIAARRGLEQLALTANVALLRLVDMPVVVELDGAAAGGPRFATVVALSGDTVWVALDGGDALRVPLAVFERTWTGQAWLFWRDFEGLGPSSLEAGSRGPRVQRLQDLLARIGLYTGPAHGVFDHDTREGVLAFQRSRYILADGVVGRLTRVVLYAAVGGYPRPTLEPAA